MSTQAERPAQIRTAAAFLRGARHVTVVCHENPDADTLGGGLAIARALEQLGASCDVVCATRWPSAMGLMPGLDRITSAPPETTDAVVLIDCATLDRAGGHVAEWILRAGAPIVNIDHHASNDGYGTVACVDRAAAATSEVVADVIAEWAVRPDVEMATLLLAGIVHDTGNFSTAETSPRTLRLAADLIEAGAPLGEVSAGLFASRPVPVLRLWGRVLADLRTSLDERVVIGRVTAEVLRDSGIGLLEAEDLPELIASAHGAEIALLLREIGARTRVSVRTGASAHAARIAAEFGGGGHRHAAGCVLDADVDAAERALLEACARHLDAPA